MTHVPAGMASSVGWTFSAPWLARGARERERERDDVLGRVTPADTSVDGLEHSRPDCLHEVLVDEADGEVR